MQLPTRFEAKAKVPLLRKSNCRPSLLAAPREDVGGVEGCEGFPIIRLAAETSAVEGSIARTECWKNKSAERHDVHHAGCIVRHDAEIR